jgi:PAS domain S-box-containing protein
MTFDPAVFDSGPAGLPASRRSLRILVVDDDSVDRRAVRRCLLESNSCETIDEVDTASELLERLTPTNYDCILLDYYMPGISGADLLQRILKVAPEVPVVMLTGRGDEQIAVEVMKSGASDYLPKASLTSERLIASVRHAIDLTYASVARRRAEEELRRQEERFRTLANAIPQMAWTLDAEGVNWFNQRWYEYTGTTPEEVAGWKAKSLVHPEHVQRVMDGLRQGVETGEPWEDTFPLRGKDGTYRWFLSRAVPIRQEGGAITGWLGTNTDVTEQTAAQAERERLLAQEQEARAEAERALQARDEVLAFVAHDLRTPLSTITTSVQLLHDHPELTESYRVECLELIQRSTAEMERLIRDLLDVARIEAGGFTVQPALTEIPPLLFHTRDQFRRQAESRQIVIECQADSLPSAVIDRDRVIQVLSNLLGNALKFTPVGGRVMLAAQHEDGFIVISVADTGAGIPAEHLPQIFNRFWQADRASGGGAGLGLAICKGIVDAHGGRIQVESTPGKGTTVRFSLPARSERVPVRG